MIEFIVLFFSMLFLGSINASYASEKVSLQLAWKHQFQFAGYYAALHRGYYEQAGLDVDILEGGEGKFAREEVLSGRARFGVAGAELILHRQDGDPFVVLAPIFQHSPSILLYRMDSGITNLQDLIGKRVMLLPENKDADILAAFFNEGISLELIQRLDQTYNLNDLIEGRTDAVSAYVTNEPWLLLQEGVEPAVITPQTYGVDFYSDCLFTTEDEIEKHPKRVQAFLNASLLGWEYAMAHPGEIIELLVTEYGVKKSRDHLWYEAESIQENILPHLVEIGHMNHGRWRHIAKTYEKLGMIDGDFSLEGFLYDPASASAYDYTRLKRVVFAAMAIILLLGTGAAILFFFNRKLTTEVVERRRAEEALIESEERLRTILDGIPDMVLQIDADMGIMWANKAALALNRNAIGRTCHNAFPGRISVCEGCVAQKSLKTGKIESGVIYQPDSKTAGESYWENICVPLKDGKGEVASVIEISRNITDRMEADKKRRQIHKAESLNRMAGAIAHKFNNQLYVVIGNLEMVMSDSPPDSPQNECLTEALQAANCSAEISGLMLTYVGGNMDKVEPIDLSDACRRNLLSLQDLVADGISFETDLMDTGPIVRGSSAQMKDILTRLITNAVEAIDDGGGKIVLATGIATREDLPESNMFPPDWKPDEDDYGFIEVADTGCGIASEHLDEIFDPFFSTKFTGRGLGLAVVLGIARRLNGAFSVVSRKGRGTAFRVFLPLDDRT